MKKKLAVMATLGMAAAAAQAESTDLRISRVALFSSGVGYFEREASVSGATSVELKFRAQQINDILKSLVVQDLDGGKVGVVSYASKDPLERTLASFAVNLNDDPSLAQLLGRLRGEPITIAGPRQIAGTVVGVEQQQIPSGKDQPPITVACLNVLTETGIEQLRVDQLQGVKLANSKLADELRQALAVLAGGHDADKKSVVIHFDGQGQRRVRASFLLESPIWKTSYRLVLAPDEQPFLQGWAMVDNATEEDWKDVQLSLVSGRPISFQMDLYSPIYISRPVQDLELYASLRPPQFDAGFGVEAEALADKRPAAADPEKRAGVAMRRSARGMEGRPATPPPMAAATAAPAELSDMAFGGMAGGRLALAKGGVQSVAEAQEAGELFEYRISTPVTIGRQNSAMLPIVNTEITGQKLSIYNPATHPKYPLNGLEIENTSGVHLMQGPITIFDGNVYAGDAKLPDVKKGEKRLLAYALDLGMEVITRGDPVPEELVSFRIAKGTLWYKHRQVDVKKYVIKNKDQKVRTLLIEQPFASGWTLLEPEKPYEQTQNLLRFKLEVPAGQTVEQTVRLERVLEQGAALTDAGADVIAAWLKTPVITPAVKAAVEKLVAMRTELDIVTSQRVQCEQEIKEAVEEQARVRENLKTIQQNTDTYQRQLKKFDALETEIEQQRAKLTGLRQSEEQKRNDLQAYLLSLDVQ